jgi:two-component system NtrC family response regulator
VLLDEILQLPLWAQVRLVDFCQQGADPRLMATTTCDVDAALADGRFDPELYYALGAMRIRVPPLRHRQEDIQALAEHFLAGSRTPGQGPRRFSEGAWRLLLEYDWPGNVAQLCAAVNRAAASSDDGEIGAEAVAECLPKVRAHRGCETISLELSGGLRAMEREIVNEVIRRCRGNKAAAARALGLHRRTLYRVLRKQGRRLHESHQLDP